LDAFDGEDIEFVTGKGEIHHRAEFAGKRHDRSPFLQTLT
jgi:hypothetical protein